MQYVYVPRQIRISDVKANKMCFSPGRYVQFIPPESSTGVNFASLDKLLILRESKIKIKKGDLYYYAAISDIDVATGGVTFHKMRGYQLPSKKLSAGAYGDVLISTVRTYRKGIGYVSLDVPNMVTTNAVMNVCDVTDYDPNLTLIYVYAFLRSDFFVEQVWSMLNRGMYRRMDKGALHKIIIPISGDSRVVHYVSALTQAIIEKEKFIRERAKHIAHLIDMELAMGQKKTPPFSYSQPTLREVLKKGRLDAAIYDVEYKEKIHKILNYKSGTKTPTEMGFVVTPGPSLEIKILRTRVDSDVPKDGFYSLILPTNISEYGTMSKVPYMGTAKKLPLLKPGDIIFGESGTHRSIVLLDFERRYTTNAHGLYARQEEDNLIKSIFFRCFFDWLYKNGIIDLLAVGGAGGHFSPVYFDELQIPQFPEDKQAEIVQLYHNPIPQPKGKAKLESFVDWHRQWNKGLGIWELDREMKQLQYTLREVQDKIIGGNTVKVPF